MKSHKDLDVWQAAIDLAKVTYRLTSNFPREEQYGLVSQMRRSAVSVASNIAEGAARQGEKEFVQFLYMALGSASELDTQLEIAMGVGLAEKRVVCELQDNVGAVARMLQGLIRSVKQRLADNRDKARVE
jgi:four helix bundle protein